MVNPQGEQAEAIDALIGEVGELPVIGQVADPGELLTEQLDNAAASSGLDFSFSEDVQPWLGERLAVGYISVEDGTERFVATLETTDEDLARESLDRILAADSVDNEEREYEGVTYFTTPEDQYAVGVFDGHVVLTTLDDFEAAVDTSRGDDSLAGSDKLAESFATLDDGRLASLYLDLAEFDEIAAADGAASAEEFAQAKEAVPELFESGIAFGAGVASDQVYLEYSSALFEGQPESGETELLASVPGDAFGALGLEDIGAFGPPIVDIYERLVDAGVEVDDYPEEGAAAAFEAETGVAFDEATAAIGDGTIWVRGGIPDALDVGGQFEVTDEAVATELIDLLAEHVEADGDAVGPPLSGTDVGFSVDATQDQDFESAPQGSTSAFGTETTGDLPFANVELADGLITYGFFADREAAEASNPAKAGDFGDTEAFTSAEEALGDEFELLGAADLAPILDEVVGEASVPDAILGGSSPEDLVASFLADKLDVVAAGVKYEDGYGVQRLVVRLAE